MARLKRMLRDSNSIMRSFILLPLLLVALLTPGAHADTAHIAVASNFTTTLEQLAPRFEAVTGHRLRISAASTGKHYVQIVKGAPFDVFLAADAERPQRLEAEGHAVTGSRFTYATGRLGLWSAGALTIDANGTVLRDASYRRLAIANPKTAPYGLAAQQALAGLGLWSTLEPKLVRGENIGPTCHFVESGGAALGFVALAQLVAQGVPAGDYWLVPDTLHAPIAQQAVLLKRGADNPAARAFLEFLQHDPDARAMIEQAGYSIPAR